MAHFGVQKAKKVALTTLALAAAVSGVAFSGSPVEAKGGRTMTIGDFTIDMDNTMPEMQEDNNGDFLAFDTEYQPTTLDAGVTIYKLKENDYFDCSRDYTSLSIVLKNEAAFKAFTTSTEDADKMIEVCELETTTHIAGRIGDTTADWDNDDTFKYLFTNGSGNEFIVNTGIDWDENLVFTAEGDNPKLAILGTPFERNGKVALRIRPTRAGDQSIDYAAPGAQPKSLYVKVADLTYQDGDGNVYYKRDDIYDNSHDYMRANAIYIGSEDLGFSGTVQTPHHISLYLGAPEGSIKGVTGNDDPVALNNIEAAFGNLNADLYVDGGSTVNLNTNFNNDMTSVNNGSTLKVLSSSSQTRDEVSKIITYNDSNLVIEGGNYNNVELDATSGSITIQDGSFRREAVSGTAENDTLIRVGHGGTVTIEDGEFEFEASTLKASPEYENDETDTDEVWHNDTFAMMHMFGRDHESITINGGSFRSNSAIFSAENAGGNDENSRFTVNDGDFESKHMVAAARSFGGKIVLNDGIYNTTDEFYVWNALDDWACNELPFTHHALGEVARNCTSDGVETGRSWGTGTQGATRSLVRPSSAFMDIKGGDYSDGEGINSNATVATGYGTTDLDSDFDNDGKKDVRVLPFRGPVGDEVDAGETKQLSHLTPGNFFKNEFPEGTRIVSIENEEYCSAHMEGNKLFVTGYKYTEGDSANFCKITVTDRETYINSFLISVNPDDEFEYTEGEPLSIPEGETKTPEDLDGNPEDYEWTVVDGRDYCTVDEAGNITAVKGGGKCTVVARDEETKEAISWDITTTSPIEMEVGDTTKPSDLPEGAEDGEWSSDNTEVCTVSNDGTITALKAGTCHVTLKLEDGTIYTWTIKIVENPDTLDALKSTFTIIGAVTAGFAAIAVTARRFFGRN